MWDAHLLLTMRQATPLGLRRVKTQPGRWSGARFAIPQFDEGSRADLNITTLRQNAGRFGLAAAKAQRHIARLKMRQGYYARRIRDSETLVADRQTDASAWERRR